ncbi:hypothetical protein [Arthrobacter sp. ISL-72]|uniref:hypothetical protein n=1 Tax=Arthrobacter sp. ISL-72 TaxID=2819114 RepID=UPI001BEB9D2F|nr:hypothetical protein [Arthrobacter sp. ISL-72]
MRSNKLPFRCRLHGGLSYAITNTPAAMTAFTTAPPDWLTTAAQSKPANTFSQRKGPAVRRVVVVVDDAPHGRVPFYRRYPKPF